jgi:hypothetical protein
VSIHPDDDFNLRAALASELSDVLPDDQLAGAIIARHRAGRRRRVAGAVGLAIVFVGVGVSLGLSKVPGSWAPGNTVRAGHVPLRLAPYTLELPGQYHAVAAGAAPCGPGNGGSHPAPAPPGNTAPTGNAAPTANKAGNPAEPAAMAAAVGSGACLVMLLTSPFVPSMRGDPNLPRDARPVALGHYRAWLSPHGYWQPGGTTVVIERAEPGGRFQDLVITSAGLSQPATVSLVSAGLS